MLKRFLFLLTFSCLLVSCGGGDAGAVEGDEAATAAAAEQSSDVKTFGAEFEPEEVIEATSLMTTYTPDALRDTVHTTLKGTVNEVCQVKGCWMTIATAEGEEMMVKFKDYGFFMPLDISGREVVMNGIAYYQVTPVEELRHYAEDAGKTAEEIAAITEPKRELRFLADGVQLMVD